MSTQINPGDLDAHITSGPREGVPVEELEEASERAFQECARSHQETLVKIAEYFRDEMRAAWEAAGGDPADCEGFVELNDVVDIVRRVCEPKGKVPPFNGVGKEIG